MAPAAPIRIADAVKNRGLARALAADYEACVSPLRVVVLRCRDKV